MQTTTTLALRDAFKDAILSLTPTPGPLSAIRWSYVPSPRQNGRAVLPPATRSFDLIFREVKPSFIWVGGRGVSYSATLAVCTSYAGVEPDLRDHIVGLDGVDLRRELRRLINTESGLSNVTTVGQQNEVQSETSHYIEHVFTVEYHQFV